MDKARKNDAIHAAADRMAANYKSSQIPMYGDALRMPSRNAVIEILRDCQKLIFPVYYGDGDLLKLPPEQYSALLMEHIHEKLFHQIALTMPECEENDDLAYEISTALIARRFSDSSRAQIMTDMGGSSWVKCVSPCFTARLRA